MPGRRAEFKHFQPVAEQIDIVNRLGALIAAAENAGVEGVAAVALAERNIFRSQGDADFSPAAIDCNSATSTRWPLPTSTSPDAPLRSISVPAISLVAPVKLATNRSAGRL